MELTKKRVLSLRQIGWAVTLVYALLGCLLIVMPGYHAGDPLLSSSIGGSLRDWAYLASSSVLVYFLSQFFARKLIQGDYRISVDRTDDEKESRLRVHSTVFESIMEGVAVTDADVKIISVNPAFTHITGFKPEEVLGKNPNIMKSGRHDEEFYRRMWESIIEHGSWSGEVWNRRRNGSIKPEWLNITRVCNDAGATTNYVASFIDTSAIRASQEQLHHLAHHDNLTGLPNRLLLKDRLDQSFKRARREKCQVAVLFLDLDEFKKINDTLGHKVGDEVLKQAARRIQALLRKEDTVARLGGDEFVILLDRLDRAEDASLVARKVLSTLQQPFTIANRELYIGVSIGISIFPQDGEDSDKLVRNADIAMYRAKQLGKNLFQFYTEALSQTANYKMELEADLRNALEAGQLQLFYQPQVSLADRRIVGAEALLRWQHPEQGLIPAAEFIQLAEETGLIMPIGEWVLQEACSQLLTWDEQGAQRLRISLNISGVQLHRSALFELVQSVLQKSGVQPDRLEFDIGESTFLAVTEKNLDVLHRLQSLGVGLAIDDFGAGYTSFGYLQRLHADRLKLSRSLLEGVPSNRDKSVIVDAITSLGEKFGIPILAAGIETEEQLHFAHKIGCKTGQGFLFAEALPPDRFQRFS
ncbi:MAG: EAL domain-containing protein [Chromatiaceae bacterium]|nr:EAL domain-containing protein [Chromatiaceae bacterium]